MKGPKAACHLHTRKYCIESLTAKTRPAISRASRSRVRTRFKEFQMSMCWAFSPMDFHNLQSEINKELCQEIVTHSDKRLTWSIIAVERAPPLDASCSIVCKS